MKRRVILILFVGFLICVAAIMILFVIVFWNGGFSSSNDGLYYVVNRDTDLTLSKENAEILYDYELGIRDTIYIIEFKIDDAYRMALQRSIVNDERWVRARELPRQKLKRYVLDDIDDFPELERMAATYEDDETFFYLQIEDENIYSLEYCVAAWNPSTSILYYYRMET